MAPRRPRWVLLLRPLENKGSELPGCTRGLKERPLGQRPSLEPDRDQGQRPALASSGADMDEGLLITGTKSHSNWLQRKEGVTGGKAGGSLPLPAPHPQVCSPASDGNGDPRRPRAPLLCPRGLLLQGGGGRAGWRGCLLPAKKLTWCLGSGRKPRARRHSLQGLAVLGRHRLWLGHLPCPPQPSLSVGGRKGPSPCPGPLPARALSLPRPSPCPGPVPTRSSADVLRTWLCPARAGLGYCVRKAPRTSLTGAFSSSSLYIADIFI